MAWWPWSRTAAYDGGGPRVETRSVAVSIGDPAIVDLLGYAGPSLTGQNVGEGSVLGLSAVYRAVSLIAGTIASLPMRTLVSGTDGSTQRTGSFLDTPGGTGPDALTPYEFKETVLCHLLLHGNAFLFHLYGGAGQIVGMLPIHPFGVGVEMQADGTKVFTVSLNDGRTIKLTSKDITHIPALSTDGVRGLSPIAVARNMFATGLAGDAAAARHFANGAMMSGIVTPDDDLTKDEAVVIKRDLLNEVQGVGNAGKIAMVNRKLKFSQWSMSAEDAQFLESRRFQVEEVARFYGVPPHLLAVTENSTTFGTGLGELNRGLARFTLEPWTTRIQERLSRLLPANKKVEFDYTPLIQPAPEVEIPLLIQQVESGLISRNEARRIRNLPPVPGGDVFVDPTGLTPVIDPNPSTDVSEIPASAAQFGDTP